MPWPTYVVMDDATSTTDVAGDEWEAALIARANGVNSGERGGGASGGGGRHEDEVGCFPDKEHTCVCQTFW